MTGSQTAIGDGVRFFAFAVRVPIYRLLELIAEFDRREGWGGFGMRSCAHWLTWKRGIDLVTARQKVRVARSLEDLPGISDAMRRGMLSYSKVRALVRGATPANEHALLAVALNGTASHVEQVMQRYRRVGRVVETDVAQAQHRNRELTYFWDEDGCLVFKGRLPAEQGALVVKALQAADEALRQDARGAIDDAAESRRPHGHSVAGAGDAAESWSARQADALTLLAETLLATGAQGLAAGDRQLVTVHVNVNALGVHDAAEPADADNAEDVQCHVHDGPALARDVVRRFACDASVVVLLENEHGEVLDVGRKTRAIPPALRRALEHRDKGCRFPGCSCTRFVDAHHVEHWVDGGATRLENLVLLCRHHHQLVHEGGFALLIERGEVTVRRPGGRALERAPRQRPLVEAGHELLRRAHDELGLEIDARTGIPGWGGERADYEYLVEMIAQRDQGAARAL